MNETKTATGWDANGDRDGHEWNNGMFDDDRVNKRDFDGVGGDEGNVGDKDDDYGYDPVKNTGGQDSYLEVDISAGVGVGVSQ